ncbi:MAG: hypothetical protein RLO50_19425 [Azospirillaceae bacterium]
MNVQRLKKWGLLAAGAVVLIGATHWYTNSVNAQLITRISGSACNFEAPGGTLSLPLDLIRSSAGTAAFAVGPIAGRGLAAPVTLRFDPAIDASVREVAASDGAIALPVAFGSTSATPDRITLTCRDNLVTQVRFQSGSRANAAFDVVWQTPTETTDGIPEG